MHILHISTKDTGGAAIAALRLHQGLLESEIPSSFLFLRKSKTIPESHDFREVLSKKTSFWQSIQKKVFRKHSVGYRNRQLLRRYAGTYESFSFAESDYDITKHPAYQQADIINLHWVAGFLDYSSFFRKNQKPVVWTLHDMNPFLGGFHYEGDLIRNSDSFRKLNERVQQQKIQALRKAKIHVVTPSEWMLALSRSSRAFSSFPHTHIPYGLDLSVFKLLEKHFCREVFGLPQEKTLLLFISENIDNQRKGFNLLQQAFSGLDPASVALCAVGSNQNSLAENIFPVTGITDERLMCLLYNAADAFVLASREDNFPNVVLEATACGTPVIAFPVGGIPEVIQNGFNGILAEGEVPSADSLHQAILRFINRNYRFDREKIRTYTAERYSLAQQASAYTALYQQLLN